MVKMANRVCEDLLGLVDQFPFRKTNGLKTKIWGITGHSPKRKSEWFAADSFLYLAIPRGIDTLLKYYIAGLSFPEVE